MSRPGSRRRSDRRGGGLPPARLSGAAGMTFWRHPSGLLIALAGASAMALPLAFCRAVDPIAAHLVLGLDGMAGAAVAGYLAGVIGHWSGGRRPLLPGPVLALLWLGGEAGGLAGYPDSLVFQALAGLAIALPVLTAPGVTLVHRAMSIAPLALIALLVAAPVAPADVILAPIALILWVGGRALPAFLATEAERRGLVPQGPPPRVPAVALVALGAAWPPALVAAGLLVAAAGVRMVRALPRPDPANLMLLAVWAAIAAALMAAGGERLGRIPLPLGTHALTMAAMGGMILSVAARATMARPRGRALRPLPLHWAALALIGAATAARMAEFLWPPALTLAGALWSLGWAAFLAAHLPALFRPAPAPVFSARRVQASAA